MNSIQGGRRPLAGFGALSAWKLELHVPVALLHRRLQETADRVQEHGVEGKGHALPFRRVKRDDRLAVAIVAGLDAGEEERRLAERPRGLAGVVGLAEVGFRHRVLVLKAEERLARLRIGLSADARAC